MRSYVVAVARKTGDAYSSTDTVKLQSTLEELLAKVDAAGETVVSVTPMQAGWGRGLMNATTSPAGAREVFGGGLGFSYTDALVVLTTTSRSSSAPASGTGSLLRP